MQFRITSMQDLTKKVSIHRMLCREDRMRTIRLLFLAMIVFCSTALGEQPATEMNCSAVIRGNTAQFTFPLPERQVWSWYRKETSDNDLEYAWEVILGGSKGTGKYSFGVYLFKYPGSQEARGSINQFLLRAQSSVWDNSSSRIRNDLIIRSSIEGRNLVIKVSDKKTFSELFAQRPSIANCRVVTPYEGASYRSGIPLEYKR